MKVTASLDRPYLFTINSNDAAYMTEGFKNRIVPTNGGFTLSVYNELPGYYVQSQSYKVGSKITAPSPSTFAASRGVEALFKLGYAIDVEYNDAMPVGLIAKGKPANILDSDGRMFSANHIPQMFSAIPGTGGLLITSVNGDFDWKEQRFYGFLTGLMVPYGIDI